MIIAVKRCPRGRMLNVGWRPGTTLIIDTLHTYLCTTTWHLSECLRHQYSILGSKALQSPTQNRIIIMQWKTMYGRHKWAWFTKLLYNFWPAEPILMIWKWIFRTVSDGSKNEISKMNLNRELEVIVIRVLCAIFFSKFQNFKASLKSVIISLSNAGAN